MIPEALADRLGERVAKAQRDGRMPAVSAALGSAGELVWARASGVADVAAGRAVTADDQFRIGSITKLVTGVAIMQLRDQGALALDDPIAAHIPEAPHQAPTIRRVLSHTSGLQRELPGDVWITMEIPTREQLLERLGDVEQVLDPGAHFHYSNLGFSLLGEIVARKRGGDWWAAVQEHVLGPIGMTRTSFEAEAPAATGYHVAPYTDEVSAESPILTGGFAPAGQLWSTATDLLRLGDLLAAGGDALAAATAEEMHRVQVMVDDTWTLGIGLAPMLHRSGDRVLGGHDGAMPGFLARLVYHRKRRLVVAVLSSAGSRNDPFTLAGELLGDALEELPEPVERWRPGDPAPAELAGLLGRWWTEGEEFVFGWHDGHLEARHVDLPPEKPPAVFVREGEDAYRVESGRERGEVLRIVRDAQGEPVELHWAGYLCTRDPRGFG